MSRSAPHPRCGARRFLACVLACRGLDALVTVPRASARAQRLSAFTEPREETALDSAEDTTRPGNYYGFRRFNDGDYMPEDDENADHNDSDSASSLARAKRRLEEEKFDLEAEEEASRAFFAADSRVAVDSRAASVLSEIEERSSVGQRHYQTLHTDAIESGLRRHLLELGDGYSGMDEDAFASCAVDDETGRCTTLTATAEWAALEQHAMRLRQTHLRELLLDEERCEQCVLEVDGIVLDFARQKVTGETLDLLLALAKRMDVARKMERMRCGERINTSERRRVLHAALRAPRGDASTLALHGGPVVREAIANSSAVRDRIWEFADAVRDGTVTNALGQPFESVTVVGIGGSYLGPEFVTSAIGTSLSESVRRLEVRFVANVDPAAFEKAVHDTDPLTTMVVVVSKSWSTAETMVNAAMVRAWVLEAYAKRAAAQNSAPIDEREIVRVHFCACAARGALSAVEAWGVDSDRLFEFWSYVGGRYSSSASAGVLPLALSCGSEAARGFLRGAFSVDEHFFTAPLSRNMPALMALIGVWNVNFLELGARAVVPYCEGLSRFAAHVQQLEMESNGKSVTIDGRPLDYTTGEIIFGEPGTNAQHSFFQLLHQGQCVPCDFIGFLSPTKPHLRPGHDELMANFFAQPDALAVGKTFEEVLNDVLLGESNDPFLCPHRTFSGDRPSLSLLFPTLDAHAVGALLATYEHRCAVQGFVWDLNSWDQWGVELGKALADDVRKIMAHKPAAPPPNNPSTKRLLARYEAARARLNDELR